MSVATTAPLWGHDSREAVAARLFDHIEALISGPEALGFPKKRPRRCRAYAARVRKANDLLKGEAVLCEVDVFNLRMRLLAIQMMPSAGGWL